MRITLAPQPHYLEFSSTRRLLNLNDARGISDSRADFGFPSLICSAEPDYHIAPSLYVVTGGLPTYARPGSLSDLLLETLALFMSVIPLQEAAGLKLLFFGQIKLSCEATKHLKFHPLSSFGPLHDTTDHV